MKNTTTPIEGIHVVQYKLTDFCDAQPKPAHEVICERLTQKMNVTGFSQIVLLNSDHLGNLHPVCSVCGSIKYVKNGFRRRNPILGEFGKIALYVQRYTCKGCGRGFSASIDAIIEKGHWYACRFKEMVNAIAGIMLYSGRKIKQV